MDTRISDLSYCPSSTSTQAAETNASRGVAATCADVKRPERDALILFATSEQVIDALTRLPTDTAHLTLLRCAMDRSLVSALHGLTDLIALHLVDTPASGRHYVGFNRSLSAIRVRELTLVGGDFTHYTALALAANCFLQDVTLVDLELTREWTLTILKSYSIRSLTLVRPRAALHSRYPESMRAPLVDKSWLDFVSRGTWIDIRYEETDEQATRENHAGPSFAQQTNAKTPTAPSPAHPPTSTASTAHERDVMDKATKRIDLGWTMARL